MNESKRIYFEYTLDEYKTNTLRKKIWYLSDYLQSFSLLFDAEGSCTGLDYVISPEYEEAFLSYLHFVITHDIIGLRNISSPIIWKYDNKQIATAGKELKELIDENLLHFHGEGQISMSKDLLDLYHLFDCIFGELSRHVFNATEYMFPTLLRTDILRKAGYFNSFPNLWMSVFRLKNDYSVFSKLEKDGDHIINSNFSDYAYILPYSLPPTMCYYVYDMLSESVITTNRSITALGKSFRFENKYANEYGRLWDFSIRETVFLGDSTYVSEQLEKYRSFFCKILEMIGIAGHCEYANDPFFLGNNNSMRINIQKMKKVKAEIRIKVEGEETIAIASFNTHGQYISRSFNLYSDEKHNKHIFTGCIGVGLERFVLAFLSQFGHRSDTWPTIIKENYKDISERNVRETFINPLLNT